MACTPGFQPGVHTPRLDGKIRLAERHNLFRRVGILHDEIAGIARKIYILDAPPRSVGAPLLSRWYHIVGINDMILDLSRQRNLADKIITGASESR